MSDARAASAQFNLPPGTRLAHYEIAGLIGSGGMGQVYRAHDTKLQRDVALKVLPPDVAADPERRQRFEREARAVAALNHPNIVTIHSVDEADSRLFLTMELVSGQPLSEMIGRNGLPIEKLLTIAVPLADAVSAAHARGITHRDLKPANVMVTSDGQVKVLDFGLAKLIDAGSAADRTATEAPDLITGQGRILGTIAYMSPEQAEGKPLDGRSDIFSLGVMLYEMATGVRPFKGDTSLSTLTAIMRDTPKLVTDVNPAIPKELGRVIRRALAKDPDRRQQTGKDLRNELDEIRQELESGELSESSSRAAIHAAASPPRTSWAAIAGALAIIIAVGAGIIWSRRESTSTTPAAGSGAISATVSAVTQEDGLELFPSLSPDGKWVVYTRDEEDTGRNDILLRAVGGQTVINLTKDSSSNNVQPAFSPDGDRIAFRSGRDGGGLFVMGRTGESVRKLTTEGFNPSWSPDGESIVYASESVTTAPGNRFSTSELWIASITTGARRQLPAGDAVQPSWSPHGQRIAYWGLVAGGSQRDLWTIAAGGGEPVRATSDAATDWSPAWSPEGRYLYFSSDRSGGFSLWRVAIDETSGRTAGEPVAVPIPRSGIAHLSFSADGTLIAMSSSAFQGNIEALVFDQHRGSVGARRRVTSSTDSPGAPSVSPDGQWIAFDKTLANGQQDLWVVKSDGTGLRQLTNDAPRDRLPRWSADGKRLMFYSDRSGRYQIWTIAGDGGGLMQVTDQPGSVTQPAWSRDGTRAVASGNLSTRLLMFDPRVPAGQQTVEELPSLPSGFTPISWSPDGTRIAGHVSRGGARIVIYTLASRTYDEATRLGGSPEWLPDGRRLLFTSGRELLLLDTTTKISKPLFSSPRERIGAPGLSPDAREIYLGIGKAQSDIVLAKLTTSP
jgi:serine/threonine protein kinase